jgi:hypothetical protein
MSKSRQLRTAKKYAKDYAVAVVAAEFIFSGVSALIATLKYPLSIEFLKLSNAVIRQGFRGWTLLPESYAQAPWWYLAAEGAIGIAVGVLVGLWANSREQRRPASDS